MFAEILIVEDEDYLRENLMEFCSAENYRPTAVGSLAAARAALRATNYDLVILDLKLPDGSGLEVLSELGKEDGPLAIVVTAFPEVQTAVRALKFGAFDYINKPFDLDELSLVIKRALETRELRNEVSSFRTRQKKKLRQSLNSMVGDSPALARVRKAVDKVAGAESTTALILGESGVGKELVAEAIHDRSARREGPLLKINCAAIPGNLLESELFGHEKGAFTDAVSTQKGVFELANNGTLFLDEIAEMEFALQAKMLRVLEENQITRVGSHKPISINVRIVTATNRDLQERVRNGLFREDLYYRLNVFPIVVAPLRERAQDILPLAERFLQEFTGVTTPGAWHFTTGTKQRLLAYDWPGNVRELRNLIERAVLMHAGPGSELVVSLPEIQPAPASAEGSGQPLSLADVERQHILAVYRQARKNKTQTADLLGINRLTLRRKLKEFGVE